MTVISPWSAPHRTLPFAGEVLVPGNLAQLERVVTNLVVNARDAMPRGGFVRIEVRQVEDEGLILVTDQGRGIPADVRERIFEPFFTTRGGAGGTGLGLATVALIVEQHRGCVSVESTDTGTTFVVRLPIELAAEDEGTPSPR